MAASASIVVLWLITPLLFKTVSYVDAGGAAVLFSMDIPFEIKVRDNAREVFRANGGVGTGG